ncbi:hypothetical protein ACFVZR_07595 [Streptomyces sp. NPDC058316]|uniref:hypothetical protein n=1 Tax=Streptomyces sp. NPDC058316 TaxID=3346442 RepID=UPI0036E004E3
MTPSIAPTAPLSPADAAAHEAASYVRTAPTRLPGMLGAVIDALSVELRQPVTRYSLQRAISEAASARHGVTVYAEQARAADTHTATVILARVPYVGLTHGQYVRRIRVELAA